MSWRKMIVRQLRETFAHAIATPSKRASCASCDVLAMLLSGAQAEITMAEAETYKARALTRRAEGEAERLKKRHDELRAVLSAKQMAEDERARQAS